MKNTFVPKRKNLRVAWRTPATVRVLRDLHAIRAVTRNVSVQGVSVFCSEVPEPATPVTVSLNLHTPGAPTEESAWPVELRGRVARSDDSSGSTMAIQFDGLSAEQCAMLRAAVLCQSMRLMERIAEFPAFWDLSELEQLTLTTVCHEVCLKGGEKLVGLGDEATSLFVVKTGRLQLTAPGRGDEVEIAHPGQVFGEVSALLGLPHNLDIAAQVDTELLAIPRSSLAYLREHNANLALILYEIFTAFMGRRLRKMTSRVFTPLAF